MATLLLRLTLATSSIYIVDRCWTAGHRCPSSGLLPVCVTWRVHSTSSFNGSRPPDVCSTFNRYFVRVQEENVDTSSCSRARGNDRRRHHRDRPHHRRRLRFITILSSRTKMIQKYLQRR